jgi:NADPH:quinone reductase-like Zn-dependent oxidoreductase
MKAVIQNRYGEADVLRLAEIDIPTPAAGEVLIRVRAAGVDQGVWHLMSGLPYLGRLAFGLRRPKNPVRGREVAGTIESVGADVTNLTVGDAVFGTCVGSFAEFAVTKAYRVVPKPDNLSFEQAAAMPVSACAALLAVRDRVQPGDRVLVLGASGGVGGFAVQLAKHFGADVTGVGSATKLDFMRELGADHVVDYAGGDIGTGFDLIVDTGGRRPLPELRKALAADGTVVIVGGEGGGKVLQGFGRQLRAMLAGGRGKQKLIGLMSGEKADDLSALAALAEAGAIRSAVDRTFPLAETADAVRYLRSGAVRGKVVVSVG